MSKVMGPLMSLSASQTFAGAITYSRSRGQNIVRLKSNPSNPQTTGQMANRAFLGAGGKISKASAPTGTEAVYIKSITPTALTWGNYLIRNMLGTQNVNIIAAKAAYILVGNAAKKAIFDDAAAQAGVQGVDLDGTSNTQVSAGLALWAAYEGSRALGSPNTPASAVTATEAQVFAYTGALTGTTPT